MGSSTYQSLGQYVSKPRCQKVLLELKRQTVLRAVETAALSQAALKDVVTQVFGAVKDCSEAEVLIRKELLVHVNAKQAKSKNGTRRVSTQAKRYILEHSYGKFKLLAKSYLE